MLCYVCGREAICGGKSYYLCQRHLDDILHDGEFPEIDWEVLLWIETAYHFFEKNCTPEQICEFYQEKESIFISSIKKPTYDQISDYIDNDKPFSTHMSPSQCRLSQECIDHGLERHEKRFEILGIKPRYKDDF